MDYSVSDYWVYEFAKVCVVLLGAWAAAGWRVCGCLRGVEGMQKGQPLDCIGSPPLVPPHKNEVCSSHASSFSDAAED